MIVKQTTKDYKNNQMHQVFNEEMKQREKNRHSLSVGDIIDHGHLSYLNNNSIKLEKENFHHVSDKTILLLKQSSLMKSLKRIERKHNVSIDDNKTDKDYYLVLAINFMKLSQKLIDSGRLQFEAGILFSQIQMHDRALICFKKAIKKANIELIVDTYDLPESVEYQRKVLHMSRFNLQDFLSQRNIKRQEYIELESSRHRLRQVISYCYNVQLYLISKDYDSACSSLRDAFHYCDPHSQDYYDVLLYMHSLFTDFSTFIDEELSPEQKLLQGTGGQLLEAHISVLHELRAYLQAETDKPPMAQGELASLKADVLSWLGRKYAQKSDFKSSQHYYEQVRLIQDRSSTFQEFCAVNTLLPTARTSTSDSSLMKILIQTEKKNLLTGFEKQASQERRRDYSVFGGRHQQASTRVYTIPSVGWEKGSFSK